MNTKQILRSLFLVLILATSSIGHAQDNFEPLLQDVTVADFELIPMDIDYDVDWRNIWHFKKLEDEVQCLAMNIYWEGRLEPEDGQTAIGLVTINRLKTQQYADSICKVVYQKNRNKRHKWVAQFSWVTKVKNKTVHNIPEWEQCLALAKRLLADAKLNNIADFTGGATYYHTIFVHPNWPVMENVGQHGLHIFFRSPDEAKLANGY